MLPDEAQPVALRLTITDHVAELDDALDVGIELRNLDNPWFTLATIRFTGYGRDYLASTVEDLVHAWHYEDLRAVLREAQRNERLARKHHRKHSRISG